MMRVNEAVEGVMRDLCCWALNEKMCEFCWYVSEITVCDLCLQRCARVVREWLLLGVAVVHDDPL